MKTFLLTKYNVETEQFTIIVLADCPEQVFRAFKVDLDFCLAEPKIFTPILISKKLPDLSWFCCFDTERDLNSVIADYGQP